MLRLGLLEMYLVELQLHQNLFNSITITYVKGTVTHTFDNMRVFPFIFPHKQKLTKREK